MPDITHEQFTTERLQAIVPRLSWWKDVKGRNWVVTGYTEDAVNWLPSSIEIIELFAKVPVYIEVHTLLDSIEKGLFVQII